jgi:hypothetical protein
LPDPVSWLVVERGWEVLDRDGERVGHVEEILGDENADIFDGLSIATSLLGESRYVPAEQVTEIREGCVRLALSAPEVEALAEYDSRP